MLLVPDNRFREVCPESVAVAAEGRAVIVVVLVAGAGVGSAHDRTSFRRRSRTSTAGGRRRRRRRAARNSRNWNDAGEKNFGRVKDISSSRHRCVGCSGSWGNGDPT